MVSFLNMIFSERDDDLSLMDNNGNKGALACVEILQRNSDIGISLARDKFDRFSIPVNQTVQALNMRTVAVFTGTDIAENC